MSKEKTLKPDYYKSKRMDIIDVAYEFDLPFDIGNIWKYTVRAGKKDPQKELEDLEKAKEYLERRIEYVRSKT